jgi:hypothetical protein
MKTDDAPEISVQFLFFKVVAKGRGAIRAIRLPLIVLLLAISVSIPLAVGASPKLSALWSYLVSWRD